MGNCLNKLNSNNSNAQSSNSNTSSNTQNRVPPLTKSGLVVGLNYTGTSAGLNGCINDAKSVKSVLRNKFGYKNVTLLTDRELSRNKNVLESLIEFVSNPTDIMVFHYSGHGTQIKDYSNDEPDGLDEALYTKYGILVSDDEINKVLRKLPATTKFLFISDSCHSGSQIDLPWQLNDGNISEINEDLIQADIISISGCRDNQVSMDIQSGPVSYGALTNSLTRLLNTVDPTKVTWKKLVDQLRVNMRHEKYAQVPQLCVSRKGLFDEPLNL